MKNLVAGVNIDGNETNYALVDEFGKIYAKGRFKTAVCKDFKAFVAKIKEEIDALSQMLDMPHHIAAVGVSAPNGNYYTGDIEGAANLAWKGKLPLSQQLGDLFGNKPVVVTNDANAAAIGEMIYGGAKGMKNFAIITIGTGLGSGIVIDGNVVYGHDGFAGELGHIKVIRENGRQCGCGRKGCLECYASAPGIKRTAVELMSQMAEASKLRDIPYNALTSKDVALAAKSGDPIAKKAFEITGEILGEALANLVAITSPEAIFIHGSVAQAEDIILNPTKRNLEKNVLPLWKGKIKVVLSSLDYENAPILGAAALAIKEIEKKNCFVDRRKVI